MQSAEVFPMGIRSVCLVFTTCAQWLGQFIIVYSTPYMMTNIKSGTFFLFGSSVVFGCLFSWLFVPETKGFSLEEMDILFTRKGLAYTWRRQAEESMQQSRANDAARATSVTDKKVEIQVERVQ
jgi:hypothetical protein